MGLHSDIVDPENAFNGIYYETVGGSPDTSWYAGRTAVSEYKSRLFLDLSNLSGFSGAVEVLSYPVNNGYSFTFLVGVNGVSIASVDTGTNAVTYSDGRPNETFTGWIKVADDVTTVNTIDFLDFTDNAYPCIQAIRIGGVVLEDSGVDATVISTDLANNTMTVDGGEWKGSDGSATGATPNQDEVWSSFFDAGVLNPQGSFDGSTTSSSYKVTTGSATSTWTLPIGKEISFNSRCCN